MQKHYITNEILHSCLMLTDHLLTPCNDLQKIPLGNIYFLWVSVGSYLKGNNGKYCVRYAIATSFEVVEAASLSKLLWPKRLNNMLL